MGATFCNIVLKTDDCRAVKAFVKEHAEMPVWVSRSASGGYISACPEPAPGVSDTELAPSLSKELQCSALYILVVHDSCMYYAAYVNGEMIDEFNDNPDEDDDIGTGSPEGGSGAKLCEAFGLSSRSRKRVDAVIHKTGYVFHSDHFFDLLRALKMPTITMSDSSIRDQNRFTKVVGPACVARAKARDAWRRDLVQVAMRINAKRKKFEQVVERGRKEGLKQGLKQGLEQGIKENLEFILELKFGNKSSEFLPIIAKIKSARDLSTFKNRLKKAQTAAELKKFYK